MINLSGFFVISMDFHSGSSKRTLGTDATLSLYCSHVFGLSILFYDDKSKEHDLVKKQVCDESIFYFYNFSTKL